MDTLEITIDTLQRNPIATQKFISQYFSNGFFELFILGIMGVLIHAILKVQQKKKEGVKVDLLEQLFNAIVSSLIVGVIVYIREDIVNFLPLTKTIIVGVGYSAQSVFLNLMNFTKKKIGNDNIETAG